MKQAIVMTHNYSNTGIAKVSLCVLVMSLLVIAGCAEEAAPPPPKPVKALQISDPDALAEGSFPGRAAAAQEANMSFRVSGPLVDLPVSVGDEVTAGTVVARIDPNDFQVMLNNAESLLAAAQATFRRADADYNRLRSAQQEDAGATSQRAVDLALAARDAA
ncbi:MAG: biotin/lipoyl-binding protein, partial [Woeseiaceae bacterium]